MESSSAHAAGQGTAQENIAMCSVAWRCVPSVARCGEALAEGGEGEPFQGAAGGVDRDQGVNRLGGRARLILAIITSAQKHAFQHQNHH